MTEALCIDLTHNDAYAENDECKFVSTHNPDIKMNKYLLRTEQSAETNKKEECDKKPTLNGGHSVENIIKDLQNGNPNIESVFIDSDEENSQNSARPFIMIKNMVILNSCFQEDMNESQNANHSTSIRDREERTLKKEINVQNDKSEHLSFQVSKISPIKSDKTLLENSRTGNSSQNGTSS